ncbi:MAG: polyribonucleotide nucleotidyltransferase [Candidatus Levybacteria bacterium]|nr:polyribonucleotide nucleotidyltransferase [Candidatus Levybacteria bacterium]MBP9814820.1 polyribonucleotide nucleotidyltransferase [Candidatus Levybacteria bacterium]
MKKFKKSFDINGRTVTLETGLLAEQTTAAVLGRMGDTMVLTTVVMGANDTTLDYFPLSVEYVERLYAGGRIKGSRWVKREGRPSDDAILTARLIDRSIRPLFPKELKKDVQVVITVLSVDGEHDPDVLSAITTSAALSVSKIPWNGPIGTSRVGLIRQNGNEELVINPHVTEYPFADMDLIVSSLNNRSIMIEAGAKQVEEKYFIDGIKKAKEANAKIIDFINEMVVEIGDKKVELSKDEKLEEVKLLVEKSYKDKMHKLIADGVTREVGGELGKIAEEIYEAEKAKADKNGEAMELDKKKIATGVDYVFKKTVREMIVREGKRPDGRGLKEIRKISAEVGILPRTHGSAVFTRGETQVLSVATLGSSSMEQLLEGPEGEEKKRYMHHYSFPPYSVGETGRMGSPNRREIGHGALAERALEAVLPESHVFPYAIRVVSEVMSSNGSTSQASVCGSTLALMDAGVPLLAPVGGIAIGLMTLDDKSIVLTDIIGLEDFAGDMDFKVAGTTKGITAIQMDTKIAGLTDEVVEETLEDAKNARTSVLESMMSVMPEARKDVSKYAPKIKTIKINPEKIGEVIGSGGKTIRNISASTGATVDVEEDGTVSVAAVDEEAVEKAAHWIDLITRELTPGEVFDGTVKRVVGFGAFVEIVPGKEGLVHVSEMSSEYVADPNDVVKLGQEVKVRVKEVDDHGRINLSMLFGEAAEKAKEAGKKDDGRGGDRGPRDDKPRFENRERRSFGHGGAGRRSGGSSRGPRADSSSQGGGIRNEFGSTYSGTRRPRR